MCVFVCFFVCVYVSCVGGCLCAHVCVCRCMLQKYDIVLDSAVAMVCSTSGKQ